MQNPQYTPAPILSRAKAAEPANRQLVQRLKNRTPVNFDGLMADLHHKAFSQIDCLQCGNCCRALGPRITERDIEAMAKFLAMRQKLFIATYLRIDEDGDHVFKTMPCPFLGPDNYCAIYAVRPKACREYPHTNHKKMVKLLPLALKNAETCPAIGVIFDELRKTY